MADPIIPRTKLVEIPITSTGIGAQFTMPPNLDDLNFAVITQVATVDATALTTAPSQNAVVAAALINLLALTLAKNPGSDKTYDTTPLYFFTRELNAGHWFQTKPFMWNPTSSFVQVMGTGLSTGTSICLLFGYIPINKEVWRSTGRLVALDADVHLDPSTGS